MTHVYLDRTWYHRQVPMVLWCVNNLGEGGWIEFPENTWSVSAMFGNTTFSFTELSDAEKFAERWDVKISS